MIYGIVHLEDDYLGDGQYLVIVAENRINDRPGNISHWLEKWVCKTEKEAEDLITHFRKSDGEPRL